MKLNPIALGVTAAIVWGAAIFIIGGLNSLVPGYGDPILALVVSIYPGYDASGALGDLLLGTTYAFFDGLAGGFVFALMYNGVARLTERAPEPTGADTVADTEANEKPEIPAERDDT